MLTPTGVTAGTYRNAILTGAAKHARLVFPVQNVTLTDDNISASGGLSLSTIMNPDIDLVMGKAIMSEVCVNLINSDIFNGFDWTEEFHLDFGIDINGSTYWVTIGYFKGKKPERTVRTQTIQFVAHDRMQKFDVIADEFIDSIASGTFSIRTIYRNLCTYVGLSYSETNSISDAMTATFTSAVWKSILPRGITCRALLAMIAEVNCCYAKINASGNVDLVWYTDKTSYSLTENDYFNDSNIAEETVSVPAYVRVASTDESISGYVYPLNTSGEKYTILDNPIMLNMAVAKRQSVITTMLSRFSAVGAYIPAAISAVGCWLFETGDIIQVVYNGNQTMNMPIFNRSLFYNGGCRDAYECTGNTERAEMTESVKEQYKRSGELSNKYTIVTGIDITDDGIDISGAKYLKLKAGASIEMVSNGVFDLRSENLIIRSATGTIQSWRVNQSNIPQIVNIGSTLGSSEKCYIMNMTIGGISYIDNYATDEDLEASCGLSLTYLQYTDNATLQSVREPTVRGRCRIVDNTNNEYNEIYNSQYGNLVFSKAYFENGLYAGYYRHRILRNQVNYADEIGYDLNNLLARMEAFSSQFVHLKTTSAFGGFTSDTRYYGMLFKGASDIYAQVYLYNTSGSCFEGHKSGGDWYFRILRNGDVPICQRTSNTVAKTVYTAFQVRFKTSNGNEHILSPIRYVGSDAQDNYNGDIILGSNTGMTIVGAGEGAGSFPSKNNIYNNENMYFVADGTINMYPGTANDGTVQGKYAFPAIGFDMDMSKLANLGMPPKNIPANSSLDNYKTPGSYYISTSADAATITHCPWSGCGGRIDVMKIYGTGDSYIRQIGYQGGNTVNTYVRTTGNNGTFDTPWYKFNLTQV